jgi:hypothetical protein
MGSRDWVLRAGGLRPSRLRTENQLLGGKQRRMTMAEAKITVNVERAIHDVLREFAQNLFDQHGIEIRSVNIDWAIDWANDKKPVIDAVQVITKTTALIDNDEAAR